MALNHRMATGLMLGVGLLLAACSGDDEDSAASPTSGSASNVENWCQALCGSRKKCDSSYDDTTCLAQCRNTNAAVLPKIRNDVVQSDIQCFGTIDCVTVLAGNSTSECFKASVAAIGPSQVAKDFCTAFVNWADECGGDVEAGACLEAYKAYSDETLQEASVCYDKSCSDAGKCIDAATGH